MILTSSVNIRSLEFYFIMCVCAHACVHVYIVKSSEIKPCVVVQEKTNVILRM